jgi:arylsulfatase A-like enzyme
MAVFHTSWKDEFMGVRDGKWKYIRRMKDSREELYDLEADPREKTNVAEGNPEVTVRYRVVSEDMASYMPEQYRSVEKKR